MTREDVSRVWKTALSTSHAAVDALHCALASAPNPGDQSEDACHQRATVLRRLREIGAVLERSVTTGPNPPSTFCLSEAVQSVVFRACVAAARAGASIEIVLIPSPSRLLVQGDHAQTERDLLSTLLQLIETMPAGTRICVGVQALEQNLTAVSWIHEGECQPDEIEGRASICGQDAERFLRMGSMASRYVDAAAAPALLARLPGRGLVFALHLPLADEPT